METLTVYATESDGDTYVDWGSPYATIHGAVGEFIRPEIDWNFVANEYVSGYGYQIIRAFLFFDTSALGPGAVISSVILSLYGKESTEDNTDHPDIGIVEGVQSDPIVAADYGNHRSKITLGADSYFSRDTWNIAGYNDKALNAIGRGWINQIGTTKFCLRSKGDIEIATPNGRNSMVWWSSEKGGGRRPKLVINYTIVAAPTVTTEPATAVEEETAVGNGNITDDGGEACKKRGICWNTTGNPTVEDDKSEETDTFGTGAFNRPITDLSPGTKYYVKAYAHNSAGYGYGGEESFTTKPNAPSNLTCVVQSSSQIDVNWTKGTGATKTMVRRKVGSYPSDITDGDEAYYGTGNSFSDTSLARATHYYYRAWSWVEGSDIWSDDYAEANAWTLIGAPAVTTNAATGLAAIAATLNGTPADNGGEDCECGFEWGPDVGKDITTPTESKTTGETFSQVIGGLAPNTTYHFRAFATNSVGTGYGADRTFTTALIISRAYALARSEL